MISHDSISQMLTALACFIAIYLATFETTAVILFPALLLVTGIILQFYLLRRVEVIDSLVASARSVGYYTLIALIGITVASFAAPVISQVPRMELTGVDRLLYSVLMAVAEEHFFRGAILNFLLLNTNAPLAIFGSSAIFMVYHFAVYGVQPEALVYVLIGGLALAWAAYRSGRLSPSILAHMTNNILASLIVG